MQHHADLSTFLNSQRTMQGPNRITLNFTFSRGWVKIANLGEWSIPGAGVIASQFWRLFAKIRQ
jgi:hypothetical protein